jgi:hypothetical protein
MKICPKCKSSYTDETLNFCLTDGVPLMVEELLAEKLASESSWQTAETLFDGKIKLKDSPNVTSTNSPSALETSKIRLKTASFATTTVTKTYRHLFVPVVGTILMLGVIGGIFWWLYTDKNSTVVNKQSEEKSSVVKKAIVQLTSEQETQVKKEVTVFFDNWKVSNEKKDIEAHISNYADTLQVYYSESGIDKNHVRADRLRAYQKYDSIAIQLDKLNITPESTESATAVFDKSWTMKNDQKTSTGSVQQELHISKINGKWLIDSEKDLKVYFINNRENANSNTNQ